MRKLLPWFGVLLALTALSCGGKDEDKTGPDPNTPFPHAMPTAQTMEVDLSELSSEKSDAPSGTCHLLSAVAVAWVNANVAVRLAVPAAAFRACLEQDPVYVGEETWRWTATGGDPSWTAELSAHVGPWSMVDWSMRISGTSLHLDRFLWFAGQSDFEAHQGSWTYYDPASAPDSREVVRCDWSLPDTPAAARTVEFTVVAEGDPRQGDSLHYEFLSPSALVRYAAADPLAVTEIRWDVTTGAGSTVSAQGDTCCWGPRPDYPDVDCP